MLFLLFGSSAAGKTFALAALHGRVPGLAVHDFDEIGVPAGADAAWRHRAIEQWVRRALDYQAEGTDVLLAGQTPFGELLAAPSASRLDAISACLLDCDEDTRVARLLARGPEWFELEVRAVSWLARAGAPVAPPSAIVDPGPHEDLGVLGVDRGRLAADRGLQAELVSPGEQLSDVLGDGGVALVEDLGDEL